MAVILENCVIAFKQPILLTILNKPAEQFIVRFNDFLFIPYKPNGLISYLIL